MRLDLGSEKVPKKSKLEKKEAKRSYVRSGLHSRDPVRAANARMQASGLSTPSSDSGTWTPISAGERALPFPPIAIQFTFIFCCAAGNQQQSSKVSELNKQIEDLKHQLTEKTMALSRAKADSELAVAKKELEMQKTLYEAIEQARNEGRDNAIKSLKEMKALTSGF